MSDTQIEKPLTGLWRRNPDTSEGKYLVKRRDGSVVEWPNLVMGARDEAATAGIRAYADKAEELGYNAEYVADMRWLADEFERYRGEEMKEQIYDEKIHPLMTQIIEICQDAGIDFIASFELGLVPSTVDGEDRTVVPLHVQTYINKAQVPRLIFMDMARQADLNMDSLIIGLMKYARRHGNHSSMCLHQLGIKVGTPADSSVVL